MLSRQDVQRFGAVAVIFLLCCFYFAYARYLFSARGGNTQARIQGLVLDQLEVWGGAGKVLDIGCGSGPLTIWIAKGYPEVGTLVAAGGVMAMTWGDAPRV